MARRTGFVATMTKIQREIERQHAAQLRAERAAQREAQRAYTAYQRATAAEEKEQRRLYAEARAAEVAAMNDHLEERNEELANLLAATLDVDDHLDFDTLKQPAAIPTFDPGPLAHPEPPPNPWHFVPPEPTGLKKVFGKQKHAEATAAAQARLARESADHAARERVRTETLARAEAEHRAAVEAAEAETRRTHEEVDAFRAEFEAGDPDAVTGYFGLVLGASLYPDGFPQTFRLAYVPQSRQLVVEYDLPAIEVVPKEKAYKYVKSTDSVTMTARP